jgi:hypothetical protein
MNAAENQSNRSIFSRDKKSGRITRLSLDAFARHARQINLCDMATCRCPLSSLASEEFTVEIIFARQTRDKRDRCVRVLSRLSLLPLGGRHGRHEHLVVALLNGFANGAADGDE